MDQAFAVHLRAAIRGTQERMTLDAVSRADRQQAKLALPAEGASMDTVSGRGNVCPSKQIERDVFDQHFLDHSWIMSR
jgi:hypothetical protein